MLLGVAMAVVGFLLTLDLWDFGTVIVEGVRFGAATHHYIFLGRVLLCAGTAMSVVSFILWAKLPATRMPPEGSM